MAAILFMILLWPAAPLLADDLSPYKEWTYLATPHRIYKHFCASCHGPSGDGEGRFFPTELSPRPRNFADEKFINTLTDQDIKRAITQGTAAVGKSNLCPPWGNTLQQESVEQLVSYVRSFYMINKNNKR